MLPDSCPMAICESSARFAKESLPTCPSLGRPARPRGRARGSDGQRLRSGAASTDYTTTSLRRRRAGRPVVPRGLSQARSRERPCLQQTLPRMQPPADENLEFSGPMLRRCASYVRRVWSVRTLRGLLRHSARYPLAQAAAGSWAGSCLVSGGDKVGTLGRTGQAGRFRSVPITALSYDESSLPLDAE